MHSWYLLGYIHISILFLHVRAPILFPYYSLLFKSMSLSFASDFTDPWWGQCFLSRRQIIHSKWTINIHLSFLHRMSSSFRTSWFILTSSVYFKCLKNSECYYSKMILGFQIADLNKMGFFISYITISYLMKSSSTNQIPTWLTFING